MLEAKALSPIVSILDGIVRFFILQDLNADFPIFLTPSEIATPVNPEQPEKASSPIVSTLEGITMLSRPVQLLNAIVPITFTLLGIETPAKFVQSENALSPIISSVSGIAILAKLRCTANAEFAISLVPSFIIQFLPTLFATIKYLPI